MPLNLSFRVLAVLFVLLVAIGTGMRFYKLGEWSFGYDERFTILEAHILMGDRDLPEQLLQNGKLKPEYTQYERLPRLVFASHLVHWLDYKLFGEGEFGSRCLMAVFGSFSIGVIFLLARPQWGTAGALILALLVLVWPDHVFQSQYNRFYIQPFFFLSILFLLGGRVAQDRSVSAAIWLGPTSILLVLSNAFGGVLWGILLGGLLVDLIFSRKTEPAKSVLWPALWITCWSILLLALAFWHILPLAADWNQSAQWGYTPIHAVMAFVNSVSWPMFLLGMLGSLFLLVNIREPGFGYWAFSAAASVLCIALLPLKVVYNPFYGFLFAFPLFVTAAVLVERIYHYLAESEFPFARVVGVAWIGFTMLMSLPSLASYYKDGNRPDVRSAYRYIEQRWQPGDRMTGFSIGAADWYIPECQPKIPLGTFGTAEKLQRIIDEQQGGDGRLWIVITSFRGGPEQELLRWLGRYAVFEAKFGKKRYDYSENNVDVYLVEKN